MARTKENNFTKLTIIQLRDRVANLCSNPDCRKNTIAANFETTDKTTLIGEAAHICAASSGGPRFDPNITATEIKSFENGVWLCSVCHKIVDREPLTYPVEMLKSWKTETEEYVRKQLGKNSNNQSKFDEKILTDEWFINQVRGEIADLGARYNKTLNVEIDEISNSFDALLRNERFEEVIFDNLNKIYKILKDFKFDFDKHNLEEGRTVVIIDLALGQLKHSWSEILNEEIKTISFSSIVEMLDTIGSDLEEILQSTNESYNYLNRNNIWNLRSYIENLESVDFNIFNNPYLVIYGKAGVGKSHLLADLASNIINNNNKCILILGQKLSNQDNPWSQILRNELRLNYNEDRLLEILNSRGQEQKERCLVIIDALNEGQGRYFWNNSLAGFIDKFKKYPWVGLVLSVRSEYKDEVLEGIKPAISNGNISEILHEGFEHNVFEAVQEFYKHYELPLPTEPMLVDEFKNPLFLRIYCEYRSNAPSSEHSIELITEVFNEYLRIINKKLSHVSRFSYRHSSNYVKRVLLKIAEEIYLSNGSQIHYEEAINLVIKTGFKEPNANGFLEALISENLLLSYEDKSSENEYVYFAFERFLDYLTAENIVNSIDPSDSFDKLFECDSISVKYKGRILSTGVLSILSVLFPVNFKLEFFEVFVNDKIYQNYSLGHAFIDSLLWRCEEDIYLDRCKVFFDRNISQDGDLFHLFINLRYQVAGRTNHPFNAKNLNLWLNSFTLADRDALWTTHISSRIYETSSIYNLINWAKKSAFSEGLSNASRRLVGISLSWLFTSTNIKLRDNATLALVRLLQNKLSIAFEVIEIFKDVNDPYVLERVFASIYGAVLSSQQFEGLHSICDYLVEGFFTQDEIYPNVLVRDYARNIVEYAQYKEVINISEQKLELCRPPYISEYPTNLPTRKEIVENYHPESIVKDNSEYRFVGSKIISSMTTEYGAGTGGYGDFGRYVFQSAFRNFKYLNVSNLSNYAVQLIFERYGYDLKKHEDFDKHEATSGDQHTNGIERIGKKYQWIALYEVFARVSDNHEMIDPSTKHGESEIKIWYDGSLDNSIRDIDPTFIAPEKDDLKIIMNPTYEDWYDSFEAWVTSSENLIKPRELILKKYADQGWFSLQQYITYEPKPRLGEDIYSGAYQKIWYKVQAYLIKDTEFNNVIENLNNKNYMGNWMPQPAQRYYLFNLEYYWSPLFKMYENQYYGDYGWRDIKQDFDGRSLGKAYICTEEHNWEGGKNSDLAYGILSPSKLVWQELNLVNSKYAGAWLDENEEVVLFDGSLYGNKVENLLIRRDKLEELQSKTGCRLVWTILGEKIAMDKGRDGINKRLEISGLYYYENGEIKGEQDFFVE
ncbi:NACHT domain-containing protein [Psychrobacter sp. DAB_AL43B]|uniref:NACHT domain-containing protein n=1 Tax=Psychrobacter sp. DAB_AL43B TaxID=1028416 RepID=UPI0009A6BBE3|nr:hypothetical protein [Psychrobacter sp. DAB_AL43B]SLJ83730.1 hypothetical protein DABAL43B_0520 [Psychrobacter sp. DAB_AL43B]